MKRPVQKQNSWIHVKKKNSTLAIQQATYICVNYFAFAFFVVFGNINRYPSGKMATEKSAL